MHRFWFALALCFALSPAPAQSLDGARADALVRAIVAVSAEAVADARTNELLGRSRSGSGIVIDARGHILTIGYLVIEARSITLTDHSGRHVPAALAGYDHATGLAVLRPLAPLNLAPLVFGSSAALHEKDLVLAVPAGGKDAVQMAQVLSLREFSGSWEYLLDQAIFTAPPTPRWAGAAIVDRQLQLVGVGSLLVRDAAGDGSATPGNMFVPIDILKPILADLIARGRRAGPAQPWLGIGTEEFHGGLIVTRVSPESPAARAGIAPGDVLLAVGRDRVLTQAEFYRRLWALGAAGIDVPLRIRRDGAEHEIQVRSIERTRWLRNPAL